MAQHERNRRLWIIDAGYLLNAQRTVGPGYQFDYKKLRDKLENTGEAIWRAYYLNSTPNPTSDVQDAFHNWLRSAPPRGPKIITKLYPLKTVPASRAFCDRCQKRALLACPSCQSSELSNKQQKGVDVGIATLALTLHSDYDVLVLSSGDGDLLDAIEHLSQSGKSIELAVFKDGVSTELQSRADKIYWLDDFKDDIAKEDS